MRRSRAFFPPAPSHFNNLIGNTVKCGGPGLKVGVDEVGGEVQIPVEGTGSGVPNSGNEAVFHRYEQQKHGVGL